MQNEGTIRPDHVKSLIYQCTCQDPDSGHKQYIGQTRTHTLNQGKYRRFGAMKRWDQHVSEARVKNEGKQSWKLNNAIRKYGAKNFVIEVICVCEPEHADVLEEIFIEMSDSVKNGYNICEGGKGIANHAIATKKQISASRAAVYDAERLGRFEGVLVERVCLAKHLETGVRAHIRGTKGGKPYRGTTRFYGTQVTLENAIERSTAFALSLIRGDTTKIVTTRLPQLQFEGQGDQIAGNP